MIRIYLLTLTLNVLVFPLLGQLQIENADKEWFVFDPTNSLDEGVIGMSDWLEKPAGKHGFLTIGDNGFQFEDGTPIQFWGTNHSGTQCGPGKEEAENRVAWYAKMGINAIRFHKYTYPWAFGSDKSSSKLKEEGWRNMDYYMHQLRKTGIYYGWSPIYGHRIVEADSSRILAYNQIHDSLDNNIIYLVNFAPDLQKILIDLMVHMLEHKNPHTGLKYANDPALAFVELQNEDNIFWLHPDRLNKVPFYKEMFCRQYSGWLKARYLTQEGLVNAWGEEGMNMFEEYHTEEEHLEKENIYPIAWFPNFSPEAIKNSKSPKRLYDNAEFLYETQNKYYQKYTDAIRKAGYKGPVVGSCWMAGYGVSHYYNLHSDYLVGVIDRHNYFAARPHSLEKGAFPNHAMVSHAGSGLLSSGLMATRGRPFVLSEWTSKMPNEWIAEGPAIIGVYGCGLQRWGGSFHFNARTWGFSDDLQDPNAYNTNLVTQIGLFPALARMIYRNDVSEGKLLPDRHVNIPWLSEGKIGFNEKILQNRDIKELGGDMPVEALALGKMEIEFTKTYQETTIPDYTSMLAERKITANTGELFWDYSDRGYFTVNTDGTKAVTGFTGGKNIDLGDISIQTDNPFALVFVTSIEKNKSINNCQSLLVTTMARARNTGMKYTYEENKTVLNNVGKAPLLLEPVNVKISLKNREIESALVLDHDGLKTTKNIPVKNGSVELDGSKYKAIWYEIKLK